VLVLCGGLSPERDVSIRSGRRVAEALRTQGMTVTVADVDSSLLARLQDARPDCVLPALHGAVGEDGSLADVLTTVGVPYVGSAPDAARISFDKAVAKAAARHWGLATPDSVALPHSMFRELGAPELMHRLVDRLGLPLVVKPTRGGSSLGASVVHEPGELPAAMVGAYAYGEVALIEQFARGTEVAVSIVAPEGSPLAMPAVEIVPDSGFYDYNARYTAGMTEFFCPARIDDDTAGRAEAFALEIHRRMALRDYSRVDMIIDAEGRPTFLEVNVAPGITETSLLPQALEAASRDLGAVFARLVHQAVQRG
jgi:D-alanine-D-alanine ligase